MNDFSFITDDTLRALIERDKKEMDECLINGQLKSTIVMAGSLIEAIFVDYFLTFPPEGKSEEKVLKLPLAELIDLAQSDGLISQRTKEISTVIRNYRNLIHPGKEFRLNENVDLPTATVAANLVEIVIKEIRESYSEKRGFLAEDAIAKVKLDPSFSSIFGRIIEQMNPKERIKLLQLIPDACREPLLPSTLNSLMRLHGLLCRKVPAGVLIKEVRKLAYYLHHKGLDDILFYLKFYAPYLEYLKEPDRFALLEYLISLVGGADLDTLAKLSEAPMKEIGSHLSSLTGFGVYVRLFSFNLEGWDEEHYEYFYLILDSLAARMADDLLTFLIDRLEGSGNSWQEFCAKRLRESVIDFDDIPF